MSCQPPSPWAEDYDAQLQQGLRWTGEDRHFYAERRVRWLQHCLKHLRFHPRRVLDFGCGLGDTLPLLHTLLQATEVVGTDATPEMLHRAQQRHPEFLFVSLEQATEQAPFDLIYMNGVLHHVDPQDRPTLFQRIYALLRPGGLFSLWENNPYNPGTRWIMRHVPFDREAQPVSAGRCTRLLKKAGFEILRRDFLFIFPRWLALFRFLEPFLIKLPLGGQYQLLAQRP